MNLKTKKFLFAATAILAFASCSEETYVGEQNPQEVNGTERAISFNMSTAAITRSTGSEAASALNNQFIVWGEKNENQSEAGAAPTDGNLVFPNYIVNYGTSTAYTTTSNTNDWEYVGISGQTIKYWDNAAGSYTFTAISAKPADITAGLVTITKTQTGTDVYGKGYTVTLAKVEENYPSLTDLYFADRINIAKGSGYSHNAVQFTFRNVLSQVRVGVYETIPGYAISEIKFYKQDGTTEYDNGAAPSVSAFGAVCPNVIANNFVGTVNVTYYADGDIQNHPKIEVTPTDGEGLSKTDLVLGTNFSTLTVGSTEPVVAAKFLGTTASAPTYDTDADADGVGEYTSVLPQVENTTNLKLKVNYKLYNSVTKETIQITGKTAEIPSQYLQWKANFKYTYLFKITDDDLTPITFDAVVVESENGVAEYITTVSEPSITTFGVKSGVYTTGKNEYETGTDIYATFVKGSAVQTPVLTGNVANRVTVYSVDYKAGATEQEKAEKPITELSVANAIEHTGGIITATDITSDATTYFTVAPSIVNEVPAEDGSSKDIDALKLTGVKTAGKYAVEIVTYEEVTLSSGASLAGYYLESSGTYTKQDSGEYSSGTYYKQVKTYKVITVVAAPTP